MMSEQESSVTEWLDRVRINDPDAARRLWNRYFQQLVDLARKYLAGSARRVADEEDVALSAFHSFFVGTQQGRFPNLEDRDDLWRLLVTITQRHAIDLRKHERRQKRGGGTVKGDSAFLPTDAGDSASPSFDQVAGPEPTPDEAAALAEEFRQRFDQLQDPSLRQVAEMKMAGYSNEEIANAQACVVRTVERRLQMIRRIWEQVPAE
jgi:RNA polymerase sigma factor (sigma-70 family)